MKKEVFEKLCQISGSDYVIEGKEKVYTYLFDASTPEAFELVCDDCIVVKPGSTEEVSAIMKYANETLTPVVVRGGATGMAAGAIPYEPSIIMVLERFNKILDLDRDNQMIVVETAVTLADLNESVAKEDIYFPCHPGDEGAQVGGMVVMNAGGARAVKYGVMRSYVKGIKVVLPTGEIVTWGGKILKNTAGFDLLHLMIGSEGALGIVTEVTLRLHPRAGYGATVLMSFDDYIGPSALAGEILKAGIIPLAIEYVGRQAMIGSAERLGYVWPSKQGKQNMIVILDEETEDLMYSKAERIVELGQKYSPLESIMTDNKKEQREILEARSSVHEGSGPPDPNAPKPVRIMKIKAFDLAVPPASMAALLERGGKAAAEYGTVFTGGGHLGDGNIHGKLKVPLVNGQSPEWEKELTEKIWDIALDLGGTLSAEHGVGKQHVGLMKHQFSERERDIMAGIKKSFDPNNVLNRKVVVNYQ